MQYGGLWSSVTCVTTFYSNNSFASPMHRTNQSIVGQRLVGCCSTHAQVRHAAPVVFPVDYDGGKHVYWVHPINVQLVTDPVIMPAKEEHGCDSGSENLDNTSHMTSCIVMLKDVINVLLLQKGQNDRMKNIVSVFYGIQCSLHNFELSASCQIPVQTITLPPPKLSGLIHTLVHKMFPTPVVHTITSIAKTKWKSGFITKKDVLPGVKSPTTVCTSPC
jgi:hypothetical protein